MGMPLNERIATLLNHAEAFADEAADIELHDVTDTLRLGASRLAIDGELVDAALQTLTTKQTARAEAQARLRACSHRVELELANRFPQAVVSSSLTPARISTLETARFRLRRFTPDHLAVLGSLAAALQATVTDVEVRIDDVLGATERACIARARAEGRLWKLRLDVERSKALLLEVLPSTSAAAARVRKRVVRTRNSTDGEPIE